MQPRIHGDRGLRLGFAALQMLYWCTYGSSTTYIVSYVTAVRNISASLAGSLMAVYMLGACLGQLFIAGICDRRQNNRVVFMGGMALTLLLWYGVYLTPNVPVMFILFCLQGAIQSTCSSIMDTWLIRSFPGDPNAYSPIRSVGSITYSALMLVMGFSIERIGHGIMLALPTLFAIGGVVTAWFMPEIPPLASHPAGPKQKEKGASLLTLGMMIWMFIISLAIMGIARMPILNMNVLIMENIGGTVEHSGISISFNTVGEFVMMCFLARFLVRFSARSRMLLSVFMYIASTIVMALTRSIFPMYIAYLINGMAYGVFLPACRQYVNETSPRNLLNRLHGLSDVAFNNVGGLVGSQLSGMVIDRWNSVVMLWAAVAFESTSFAIMSLLGRFKKKNSAAG